MTAFYSEFDPKAAAWLRELIKQGHIADGIVDERDLWDVTPDDLAGFTQVHLCAGIGVWSYALRRAGWSDDRPIWTGSFPCQPFSAAGKGAGFADERHLWPAGQWLIDQCRPAVIFGEQVASKDAEPWIDLVQADLEALGYGVGAIPFPSAGIGAPHIRDRLYWVADTGGERRGEQHTRLWQPGAPRRIKTDRAEVAGGSETGVVADADDERSQGRIVGGNGAAERAARSSGMDGGLAHTSGEDQSGRRVLRPGEGDSESLGAARERPAGLRADGGMADPGESGLGVERRGGVYSIGGAGSHSIEHHEGHRPGPTNGLWRDADWLLCRDGKWRPVEPGTFPLAHGAPARVGRLRGYGNAINAEAAVAWVKSYLDAEAEQMANRDLRLTGIFA